MPVMWESLTKHAKDAWRGFKPWQRARLTAHYLGYSMVRFWNDRCFSAAAALSYSMLLAMVPLLAIGFAILAAFPVFQDIVENLKNYITSEFVPKTINLKQWIDEHRDLLKQYIKDRYYAADAAVRGERVPQAKREYNAGRNPMVRPNPCGKWKSSRRRKNPSDMGDRPVIIGI